jgi:hypothetical protein
MPKPRGREHSTLTETAALVVKELRKIPGIKMIAPGEIRTTTRRRTGARHLTIVGTRAGAELLISGQSVQRVAVHTDLTTDVLCDQLKTAKSLRDFAVSVRERKPGI